MAVTLSVLTLVNLTIVSCLSYHVPTKLANSLDRVYYYDNMGEPDA